MRTRTRPFGYGWPGAHYFDEEEIQAVTRVLRARSPSRFFGMEPIGACERFEHAFAAYTGVRHGVATGSGSGALHVALTALGVGPGQEVIVPGYLWIATIAAVVHKGAIPVLCEIDDSYCMDPEDLRRKIGPRTTVVLPVHMSGAAGNVEAICAVARERGLKVLEDCAQAVGGSYRGRRLGSFGDAAIFSFQYTKGMTTGEGGMVVTNDSHLFKRCQAAQDIGHSEDYEGVVGGATTVLWGLGSVMTELQGALGLVQLHKLDRIVGAMRRAKRRLRAEVGALPGIDLRRLDDPEGDNGSFLITRYRDGETAAKMARKLDELGLRCGPNGRILHHFPEWGFHLYSNIPQLAGRVSNSPDGFPWTHPANAGARHEYGRGTLPVTDDLFDRSVLQHVPSDLTDDDTTDLVAIYREAARQVLS